MFFQKQRQPRREMIEENLFASLKDKNPNLDHRVKAPIVRMTH